MSHQGKVMILHEWLTCNRLNLKIEQELIDMGVRTTEDLDGLFEDEELLEAVTDGMSKADGIAFVKAYYRCREQYRAPTEAASIDVLCMLDCTGSTHPHIEAARTQISTFAKMVGATYPTNVVRIGFIEYRDRCDETNHMVTLPFQLNPSAFEAQLNGAPSFEGNAVCGLPGALQVAANQEWSSSVRTLFHIVDHPSKSSVYSGAHPSGPESCEFVRVLAEKKVNYHIGQLTHFMDMMTETFNKHVGLEYTKHLPMNSAAMMDVITRSVTALSIGPQKCPDSEDSRIWSAIPVERAISFTLLKVHSVSSLCSYVYDKEVDEFPDSVHVFLQCAEQPFHRGKRKVAYHAHALSADPNISKRVLKQSVYSSSAYSTKEKLEEFLAPHRAALFFSDTYNIVRPTNTPAVEFVPTRLLRFLARPDKPYFTDELYIAGQWECFNNNIGYCAPFPTTLGTDHRAVQAFSHWTYHMSGEKLMVTDCQGCFDAARNAFVLTDPAVHCRDLIAYGVTNMGERGFERFFKTHRCNDVCRALGLPAPTSVKTG